MFNLGFAELIVLFVVALIVIGPKQLPQIARVVGRTINELKRATEDVTSSFVESAKSAQAAANDTEKHMNLDSAPKNEAPPHEPYDHNQDHDHNHAHEEQLSAEEESGHETIDDNEVKDDKRE